jgi:hypothetical protein
VGRKGRNGVPRKRRWVGKGDVLKNIKKAIKAYFFSYQLKKV